MLVGHRYADSSPGVVRIGQAYVIRILCAASGAFLILNYWLNRPVARILAEGALELIRESWRGIKLEQPTPETDEVSRSQIFTLLLHSFF